MEKKITIGDRTYTAKSTARTLIEYRSQFNREFLDDLGTLVEMCRKVQDNGLTAFNSADLELLYRMTWMLIKKATPNLPPFDEWLDTFDNFPATAVIKDVIELYESSMETRISTKNP